MNDLRRIFYGEFLNGFQKRVLIIILFLMPILNYLKFEVTKFLDFNNTYFLINIGILWIVLSVWVLIWLISYPMNRRGF